MKARGSEMEDILAATVGGKVLRSVTKSPFKNPRWSVIPVILHFNRSFEFPDPG